MRHVPLCPAASSDAAGLFFYYIYERSSVYIVAVLFKWWRAPFYSLLHFQRRMG